MWPGGSPSSPNPQEEWLQSWRCGLDSVEGLYVACFSYFAPALTCCVLRNTLVNSLLPEHTLAPRILFVEPAVAGEMSKQLRFTRHSPITQPSPIAHFMRNIGPSLDWETAVKNRSYEVPDGMPVGRRIVERKEDTGVG